MGDCREFALDDLTAIVAIPVTNYTPSGDMAAIMLEPSVNGSYFSPPVGDGTITIGSVAPSGSALIPIIPGTGRVKDAESLSTAGRLHTVSVECEVDDRDEEVWTDALLQKLERIPRHLLLTSRDGTRFFVQGSEDTYLCTVSRDGEKTGVSLKVQCLMGVQRIV